MVLADDHNIFRQALKRLLQDEPDFRVVGEAADGATAAHLAETLKPDVLVIDVIMGDMNGIDVVRQITKVCPNTRAVVLSMHQDESYVLKALRAGAKAYVLKDCVDSELTSAIRQAAAGRRYLSPPLSELALEGYIRHGEATSLDPLQELTMREREVFELIAKGLTNTDIATQLCISRRTVESHRTRLTRKLGLRTRADIVRFALEQGIRGSR
jgi:DNA-binding NarL/FixJ family response regulator